MPYKDMHAWPRNLIVANSCTFPTQFFWRDVFCQLCVLTILYLMNHKSLVDDVSWDFEEYKLAAILSSYCTFCRRGYVQ